MAVASFLLMAASAASGHEPYKGWMIPGTMMSCCNRNDCRPVTAYFADDGLWRAWDGLAWLTIPREKMLGKDKAGDGRSHLCSTPDSRVLCFSPAEVKG